MKPKGKKYPPYRAKLDQNRMLRHQRDPLDAPLAVPNGDVTGHIKTDGLAKERAQSVQQQVTWRHTNATIAERQAPV
jgi:hypothetical protein